MSAKPIARGYSRVSTKMQARDGISLGTQKERIEEHCRYKKLDLVGIYEDAGISGKSMDRPSLQKLLKDMTKGSYVIVCDLDRLGRNTIEALQMLEMFKDKGINFVCLNPDIDYSTPTGELIYVVLSAIAKLQRKNIAKNVSVNMLRLSAAGKLRSRSPFGWKFISKDKDLEPIPEQQAVIEKIKRYHGDGLNLSQISKRLNAEGDYITLTLNKKNTDKTQQFYTQTVKDILVNLGLIKDNKHVLTVEQRITSHHKPKIELEAIPQKPKIELEIINPQEPK